MAATNPVYKHVEHPTFNRVRSNIVELPTLNTYPNNTIGKVNSRSYTTLTAPPKVQTYGQDNSG